MLAAWNPPRLTRGAAIAAAAMLVLCTGCGRCNSERPSAKSVSSPVEHPPTQTAEHVTTRPRVRRSATPQLQLVEGQVQGSTDDGGDVDAARPGVWLTVQGDRPARIGSADRTVLVELAPGSRFRLGNTAPFQVFLAAGLGQVSVAPRGGAALPAARVVLPGATAVLPATGTLQLAVAPSGRAWLAIVGGTATLLGAARDGEQPRRIGPSSGAQTIDVAGTVRPVARGAGEMANAEDLHAAASGWVSGALPGRDPASAWERRARERGQAVRAALPEVQAGVDRASALLQAEPPADEAERSRRRRLAVELALAQSARREDLLLRWEKLVSVSAWHPQAESGALGGRVVALLEP